MELRGTLACFLLALCFSSGRAGPLPGEGESAATGLGEAFGHRMGSAAAGLGEAFGHRMGNALSQGAGQAVGQGAGEAASSGVREAVDSAGNSLSHRVEEAAHALGNEAGRHAENIVRQGMDAAHSFGQGMPGSNGAWVSGWGASLGTNSQGGFSVQGGNGGSPNFGPNAQGAVAQPGYGSVRGSNGNTECTNPPPASGSSGSQSGGSNGGSGGSSSGNGGGSGSGSNSGANSDQSSGNARPFDEGYSVSQGSRGSSSSGNSGGNGGGNKPECENPDNEVRVSGGSGGQGSRGGSSGSFSGTREVKETSGEGGRILTGSQGSQQGQGSGGDSGRGEAVSGINSVNSQTIPGIFNFDNFWKNFKSKMGFINWDAIEKGQVPPPSTRALLYFSRLWEDFKHKTPFLNWKEITEGIDKSSSLQKRASGANQPGTGWQEVAAATSKNNNYHQQVYPTAYYGQYPSKSPAKGGVTPPSSSASRVQPGLLQWVKFW
ncbi:dermokine [Tupaia chinensis]|uniref:dermokine n=1 Tax=Tupaia chinensis TaxID=246437 RepID=UPI000FFBE965|nr:dermokine [Tupaia chinensis]